MADCRIRGLLVPAKWAAAALCGLPEEEVAAAGRGPASASPSPGPAFELARSFFDLKVRRRACGDLWSREFGYRGRVAPHSPASARSAGRATPIRRPQEFHSAAHTLRGARDALSVFLRCYATYLAGEKRKE